MKKLISVILISLVAIAAISADNYKYDVDTSYMEIEQVESIKTAKEFTWADFETMCFVLYGKTPYEAFGEEAWEKYEYYASNPQCYGDLDGQEINALIVRGEE